MKVLRLLTALSTLALVSCSGRAAGDTNVPIAQATLPGPTNFDDVRDAVWSFSRKNRFAVQEVVTAPRGMVEFDFQLFRDDIRLGVNKLKDGKLQLFAYPLCSCEREKWADLKPASEDALRGLRAEISRSGGR